MSNSVENSKPSKCISIDKARELQNNWNATRAIYIQEALGSQDTREFLFSVSELQEFLNYVKSNSTEQGIANPGVRMYFGAYNNEVQNKATVFLAPTKGVEVGSDNNYEIEALNKGLTGYPPKNY